MRLGERERVVLDVLQKLPKEGVVLVGGYALNAYVPPRFSIDCDLVVLGDPGAIVKALQAAGFVKAVEGDVPYGDYVRYVREREKVAFDLLAGSVLDRQTGVAFEEALFRKHSRVRTTVGRAHPIRIEIRIADPELLFALKLVPGRRQDIRDLFMLAGENLDWDVARDILLDRCRPELLEERVKLVRKRVHRSGYRDSLQGAYGKIPDERFDRCQKRLEAFLESLSEAVR